MFTTVSAVTIILATRSSSVSTTVSYTSCFMCPQKKSRHVRSGDLGGQATGPPRPFHRFLKVAFRWFLTNAKMGWCPIMVEINPLSNIQRYIFQQFWQYIVHEVAISPSIEAEWKNVWSNQPVTRMPAHTLTPNRCWWAQGWVPCGFTCAQTCELWILKQPSWVNKASLVFRTSAGNKGCRAVCCKNHCAKGWSC